VRLGLGELANGRLRDADLNLQPRIINLFGLRVGVLAFADGDQPAQLKLQGSVDERILLAGIDNPSAEVKPGRSGLPFGQDVNVV